MPGGKSHSEPTRWAPADPALCFSVLLLASNLQQSGAISALSRDQIGCRVVNNDQGPCLSNCCGGLGEPVMCLPQTTTGKQYTVVFDTTLICDPTVEAITVTSTVKQVRSFFRMQISAPSCYEMVFINGTNSQILSAQLIACVRFTGKQSSHCVHSNCHSHSRCPNCS